MEDAKIDLIAREVLTSLKKARVAVEPAPARPVHLQLLSVQGGVVGSPCIIEPDKPCVGSLKCRSLGH
jgi:hypothetical protein